MPKQKSKNHFLFRLIDFFLGLAGLPHSHIFFAHFSEWQYTGKREKYTSKFKHFWQKLEKIK